MNELEIIQDKNETGKTIVLDGFSFVGCIFTRCTLLYHGGVYGMTNTQLNDCPIALAGAAERTARLLEQCGWKKPEVKESGQPLAIPMLN